MADIWEELSKIGYDRRRKYFLYKNKMQTVKGTDYGAFTEKEFMQNADIKSMEGMRALEKWENSPEYIRLQYILYADNFDKDLIEVYDAIKEEAKKGNNSAVKTMLELQDVINARLKTVNKLDTAPETDNEDDGNKLDLKLNI